MEISKEDIDTINKNFDEQIKKAVEAITNAVHNSNRAFKVADKKVKNPYYSETERLLYKYPMLKLKVEQDELDIEDLQKEMDLFGGTQKSKDVVYVPNGGVRLDPYEKQEALIAEKKVSRDKALKDIKKIDRALENVKNYKGYEIIDLRYFKRIEPDDEIMEQLHIGKTTFYQWKNRIINDLSVIFFGE